MNSQQFILALDKNIHCKHLLKHDFYLAWSQGKLSIECLKEYAKEYYQNVSAFPRYLSALHSHTNDVSTRKEILQNLIEEEAGSPNHPELWKMFANNLGVQDHELEHHIPGSEMNQLIQTFQENCLHGNTLEGLASLYAYESQIPEICHSKIAGLKEHYGLTDPKAWAYFTVHIAADEEHAAVERRLLEKHFLPTNGLSALASAQRVLDCLWNFLTSLCERFNVRMCPKM